MTKESIEHKGFRDAPGVKAFAEGMEFDDWGPTWIVRYVRQDGGALCTERDSLSSTVFLPGAIPSLTLKLDSIWVGRRYQRKTTRDTATVTARCADQVGFGTVSGITSCWESSAFLDFYEPLPLDPPAAPEPTKAPVWTEKGVGELRVGKLTQAEQAKEPWKPEAGRECEFCIHEREDHWARVNVMCVAEESGQCEAWVKGEDSGFVVNRVVIVTARNLRPLPPEPPEPPVKKGDIWIDKDIPEYWWVNLTGRNPWHMPKSGSGHNWGGYRGQVIALNPHVHKCIGNVMDRVKGAKS